MEVTPILNKIEKLDKNLRAISLLTHKLALV